ncbi:MAG: hypothetical protein GWO76_04260 [Proteobacteria bacterium]|nr:hypothetical protein [Pseudomonadota bacterium]
MLTRTIFEGLGDFITWAMQLWPWIGNNVNILFSVVITVALIYWIRQMLQHQAAGEK